MKRGKRILTIFLTAILTVMPSTSVLGETTGRSDFLIEERSADEYQELFGRLDRDYAEEVSGKMSIGGLNATNIIFSCLMLGKYTVKLIWAKLRDMFLRIARHVLPRSEIVIVHQNMVLLELRNFHRQMSL